MSEIESSRVELESTDGVRLSGREYVGSGTPAPFSVLMLPGIGVPQRAFRFLGSFLARHGVRAFSIDYRGMSESRAGGESASLRIWAERDASAALGFVEARFGLPVVLFGHSFGGQVLGLSDDFARVCGAVLIASQFGQARYWDGLGRLKIGTFWWVLLPAASAVFETVPSWAAIGATLPRGAAREWGRWGRSRDWYLEHAPGSAERLRRFDRPILAVAAPDDPIAPPRAVSALLERFESATVLRRDVSAAELGVKAVGHIGLLRPPAEPVWREMLEFARRAAGTGGPAGELDLERSRDDTSH